MKEKKNIAKTITVQDVTKEIFEICRGAESYDHPTAGKIIDATQLKLLCPVCAPLLKNIGRTLTTGIVKVNEEEAQALGIKILGNPKLGIRMFTEDGCDLIGNRLPGNEQKRYFMIIRCIFHRQDVQAMLYPVMQSEPQVQSVPEKPEKAGKEDTLLQFGKFLLCQMEIIKEQTAALNCIADSMAAIQEMIAEGQKSCTVSEKPVTDILPKKEEKQAFSLKLKRGEKEAVYRTNPRSIQTFREEVLEGIPNAMHNSVLHYAYKRMRDVYGVPVDTYRNEYFADTGKNPKNSLEIVHWLEFRNPAIRGLLRSCVQNAMENSFANTKEESNESKA